MVLLAAGARVSDTLVVDRFLGQGAFAEVYRVEHEYLGRQAMKVFKRVVSLERTRELLAEARLLSTMDHPNIVRLFDAGTVSTGDGVRGYFTMEYVAGGSLAQLIEFNAEVSAALERIVLDALRLDPRQRIGTAGELAQRLRAPLAQAHERGVPEPTRAPHRSTDDAQPGERARRLADEAVALAGQPGALHRAADVLEEAITLSPSLREDHLSTLLLWRRGVVA